MNKLNHTIKKLRQDKGINQNQLAEQLHVTRQAVSNWETGKTQPDIETLTQLAEFFEVSVEQLIYGLQYKKETEETKESGVWKRTWEWGRFHLGLTFYSERMMVFGMALAATVSYVNWGSIPWAVVHGMLNWSYILYYIIRY